MIIYGERKKWYDRHRGPFTLRITRTLPPGKTGAPRFTSAYLPAKIAEGTEVEEEAQALLTDPRDTITTVYVWSEREDQCVMIFTPQPASRGVVV